MRHYTITRIKEGGILFICRHCPYQVATQQFDPQKGNCRTQAATALNQHAAALHHQLVTVPDGQQWFSNR